MNGSRVFQMPPLIHFGNNAAAQTGREAKRMVAKALKKLQTAKEELIGKIKKLHA